MKKPIIEFKNVSKVFEDSNTKVLKDINFELEEGKFYTLLGASGSGKSTILNIIAGLLDATTGDIMLDGVRINDIPTNKRDVHISALCRDCDLCDLAYQLSNSPLFDPSQAPSTLAHADYPSYLDQFAP